MLKILHAADFHLDSPFDSLPENLASERRGQQRAILERLAETANSESVDLVLLSGDLFDSDKAYYETSELLTRVFGEIKAEIFISPGNHDYFSPRSPYSFLHFPENVHIFTSPIIRKFDMPSMGCAVWGAGFNDSSSPPLLSGFEADSQDRLNIMVLHGDLGPSGRYNPISESDIAASGLNYLALGHLHSYSGIKRAGDTYYAYPGCIEGRGFDECGEKGFIIGTVSKDGVDLKFRPLGGRRYEVLEVDLSKSSDAGETLLSALPYGCENEIFQIILNGEFPGEIDAESLYSLVKDHFYHVVIYDKTRLRRDIWALSAEDTLKGLFVRRLRENYDATDSADEKEKIALAVRYGLAALENREDLAK